MARAQIPDATPLTPRQLAFVERYLLHFNATQAAKEAGYSARTAKEQGSQLLQHPAVIALMAKRWHEIREEASIDRERVLKELGRLAFADIRQLYDERGALKPPHEWGDAIAAAVTSLDSFEVKRDGQPVGENKRIKLADKLSALDKLARILGMYEADNKQQGGGIVESMHALIEAA
ncbi:MAG: terminase small subunit, partial [Pseudogulbenkiania sp.]|nr:terminase small subunit [Pseudogulbenkiania sp.]